MSTYSSNRDVAIHVTDLTKAELFYGKTLGFKLLSKTEAQLSYDTGSFCLWINKDDENKSFIPSIDVADIETARRELIAAGCKILKEFEGYKSFYFTDPFGNIIDVIQK